MKALVIIAVLAAAPAVAQRTDTAPRPIQIAATAPAACVIRGAAAGAGVNATFVSTGPNSANVQIVQLVDPSTALPRASSLTVQLPVLCNSAHTLTVRSGQGGLLRAGGNQRNTSPGGFGEFLPYRLSASWAGQTTTAASNAAGPLIIRASDGGAGTAEVGFQILAGGAPLVAGAYSDAIVVEFAVAN